MIKKYTQWFWFIGGFAVGFTLISLGHAALPKRPTTNLTELKASKVGTPELEQDFSKLTSLEAHYAESSDQQKRLKIATSRAAHRARN